MFSKACEYGIKAMIYIAKQSLSEKRVTVMDIKDKAGLPAAFTGKVLNALTKEEIVQSRTGRFGGFYIDERSMKKIKVIDIVTAIDGDSLFTACGLGLNECSNIQPCPMHNKFVIIRKQIKRMLDTTSIYELAMGLKSEKAILVR